MRLTEVALPDSTPRRICQFLEIICTLEVQPIEEAFTEYKGVLVGNILKVVPIEMESGKQRVMINLRGIKPNFEYGSNFTAWILGKTAAMLIRAKPEVGDGLAFVKGFIYPDPSFSTNTVSTSYNIDIGPAAQDQVFLFRKENTVNQIGIPFSPIGESYPAMSDMIAKLQDLENIIKSIKNSMPNIQNVLPSCEATRPCLENGSRTHPLPGRTDPNVSPSVIDKSPMGRSEAGPSNSKNIAQTSKPENIEDNLILIQPECSKTPRVQRAQSKTETTNIKDSNLNLIDKISSVESREIKVIQPTPIEPQADSKRKKQQEPRQVKTVPDKDNLNSIYKYDTIERINQGTFTESNRFNLFGVVHRILKPVAPTSKGRTTMICLLIDDSNDEENILMCHFFPADDRILKHIECGDVLRLHRLKLETNYENVDGRVFQNNDMVLFKGNSKNLSTIQTTSRTIVTDAAKKRVLALLEWYGNYEKPEETNALNTNSELHRPIETASVSNESHPDSNAIDAITMASTACTTTAQRPKQDTLKNPLGKNNTRTQRKQLEKNNNQLKKKPLFVACDHNELSSTACDISETSVRGSVLQFDNNVNVESIQNAIGSSNNVTTSTPKKGSVKLKEDHSLLKDSNQPKVVLNRLKVDRVDSTATIVKNSKDFLELLADKIDDNNSDHCSAEETITSRKRKQKSDSDDEPLTLCSKRHATVLNRLNVSSDVDDLASTEEAFVATSNDAVCTIELRVPMNNQEEDRRDLVSEAESSSIDQDSLESQNLFEEYIDEEPGGLIHPTPSETVDSTELSPLADALLFRPGSLTVKAHVTKIFPDPSDQDSLEAQNLFEEYIDEEPGGLIHPTPSETVDSTELSPLADALLFRPGSLTVKAHVTKISPDPSKEIKNIVCGFCVASCHGLSVFTEVHWDRQDTTQVPMCPICFISRGKEKPVVLMFMLTFNLLELSTGCKVDNVILHKDEAEYYLGCSVEEFVENEERRTNVQQLLKSIVLNREYEPSFKFHSYTPKTFNLSIYPDLQKVFITNTKPM